MRLRQLQQAASAEDGVTLSEMLVVLAILGVVLASLTALFTSGLHTQTDQTNRTRAQQDARTALDKMRREIRCASTVSSPSPMSVTVSLPGYCSSPTSTTLSDGPTPDGSTSVPPSGAFNVSVSSTSGFNRGAMAKNDILIGASDPVACTGVDSATKTFTGCTGGTPGSYTKGTSVGSLITWCTTTTGPSYSLKRFVGGTTIASPSGPCSGTGGVKVISSLTNNSVFVYTPGRLGTITVSLATGSTPADPKQSFSLSDVISLRNSGQS